MADSKPESRPGWARRIAGSIYGLGARLDRARGRSGRVRLGRPACRVVSVGGLTLGGAGKTPVAAALACALAAEGHRVVLASRGYRGGARERVTRVSDGHHLHASVEEAGDEALVLAAHAPGVPVLVGRDRRLVAHRAVSTLDAEILVLDDGFQHHRLARDFDLVCIDGSQGLGNERVVPAGPLREPAAALRHADALLLVDPVPAHEPALRERLRFWARRDVPIFCATRRPSGLVPLGAAPSFDPGPTAGGAAGLAGESIGLLAGIAQPASLRRTLEGLGAKIVAERTLPDHHAYRAKDVHDLAEAAAAAGAPASIRWITTEKDALKILPRWVGGVRVDVLRMEAVFEAPAELVARALAPLASDRPA